jgi:hypothetical protein
MARPRKNSSEFSQNDYPKELFEIDRLLNEVINDVQHPLNNLKHPQHVQALEAFNQLVAEADRLRTEWFMGPDSGRDEPPSDD